jgi:hypothetical protein
MPAYISGVRPAEEFTLPHPMNRTRGRRRLVVGLLLAGLALWNGADFLHDDDSPEYVPDCPVCALAKVTSCETPAVSVAVAQPLLDFVCPAVIPRSLQRDSAPHSHPAGPRGPPPVA